MKVQNFSEVRTVVGTKVTPERHFFFDGVGRVRRHHNDGQPQVLDAFRRSNRAVSGRVTGTVKVTPIKQSRGWFSLRETCVGGYGRTVYLHATALVVVDGEEAALGTFYTRHSGQSF